MSLRTIREQGDPVLSKKAKEIREMTPKIRQLIEDMKETMYDANGVGLAAPQVGMLKRLVVIDVSEEQNQPIILINPRIIEKDGEVIPVEVKAGNASTISLNTFIGKYQPSYAYKLIDGNVGIADKKITLPHYMAMFL